MRRLLIILLVLGYTSASGVGKVVIKGKAAGFDKKLISVYQYTDYITYREKKITSDVVQKGGYFQVEFTSDETMYVYLKVEDKKAGLFTEPGAIYSLTIKFNEDYNPTQVYDKRLTLRHTFPSPVELNQLISQFNSDYESFLLKNRVEFATRAAFPKIKEFRKKMAAKYNKHNNAFLNQYVDYSIANMMDAVNANDLELYKLFFQNKPVLHDVDEYMKLFAQFFQKDLRTKCIAMKGLAYKDAINKHASVKKLNVLLMNDPYLKDPTLRELYILHGLNELYNDPIFNKNNVLNMVNYIYETSENQTHKLIAYNIVALYTNLKRNAPAPEFKLADGNKKSFTLSSFEGKYVYINFWASWSIPSIKEMRIMEKLHKIYGKDFQFVSINCDPSPQAMINTQRKYGYKWKFLHLGKNEGMLEDYNVRVIPHYVIIDPQGKIVHAPAERPTGNVEKQLYQIVAANKPKKPKYRIGQ